MDSFFVLCFVFLCHNKINKSKWKQFIWYFCDWVFCIFPAALIQIPAPGILYGPWRLELSSCGWPSMVPTRVKFSGRWHVPLYEKLRCEQFCLLKYGQFILYSGNIQKKEEGEQALIIAQYSYRSTDACTFAQSEIPPECEEGEEHNEIYLKTFHAMNRHWEAASQPLSCPYIFLADLWYWTLLFSSCCWYLPVFVVLQCMLSLVSATRCWPRQSKPQIRWCFLRQQSFSVATIFWVLNMPSDSCLT